jgi:hypothetical protein
MRYKKTQSILEYVVLLCVIVSSLLLMQVFIKRAYQGRLKAEAEQIGQQYSPGHTTSLIEINTTSTSTTWTGGTHGNVSIPAGMTLIKSNTTTTFIRKEAIDSFVKD